MRGLALAMLLGLGCTTSMGLRGGRATGPQGSEATVALALGAGRPDSLGILWTSELGYATAKHQEGGAFMGRWGLDALAALTSARLLVHGGPTFGMRAAGQGEAQYSQYGLHGTVVPMFLQLAPRNGMNRPGFGVGIYAGVDRLFGGTRANLDNHTAERVESQTIFTIGITIETIAVDIFSSKRP